MKYLDNIDLSRTATSDQSRGESMGDDVLLDKQLAKELAVKERLREHKEQALKKRCGDRMHHVLVADTLKSSLVMTSEIFKDRIKDCAIHIVGNGRECVDFLDSRTPDMIVVDFDLPDTDGVMLSKLLRKRYRGPVIITAFPDHVVDAAIQKELYAYSDSCEWVKKPVRMEDFGSVIDQFLLGNRRVTKRFYADFPAYAVGQSEGRGKRAPKGDVHVVDMSLCGFKLSFASPFALPVGKELMISFDLTLPEKGSPKSSSALSQSFKIKGSLAWKSKDKLFAGMCFHKLSEHQREFFENYMKYLTVIPNDPTFLDHCSAA
ncbi:MAG: response regulator [Proteobacteria bacterium]|nr:response regulator [Pseudomonadota bacterium]